MSDPLPHIHVAGQDRQLGQQLDACGRGDALDRGEVLERSLQIRMLPDELAGLFPEKLDAALEVTDVDLDVVADHLAHLLEAQGGVQPVLLLGRRLGQRFDSTRDGPQIEGMGLGRLPGPPSAVR